MRKNLALYEALKDTMGAETADMLSDAIWDRTDVVTKADFKAEMALLRADMNTGFERLNRQLTVRMMMFFSPMWLTTWGALLAIWLKR